MSAITTRFKATPATIPAETPLAELRRIKLTWIETARALGYPEKMWTILDVLGADHHIGSYSIKCISHKKVHLVGGESTEFYIPCKQDFLRRRTIRAFFGAADSLDQVLSLPCTCWWSWHVIGKVVMEAVVIANNTLSDVPSPRLFIPGNWINDILAFEDAAANKILECSKSAQEIERQKLLVEMLVGADL